MNRQRPGKGIAWTDYTWNVVTGCSKVSEGCLNCYAQEMAHRFKWPQGVCLHPERLEEPYRQGKRGDRVFVCSMADLWHPDVPDAFIDEVVHNAAASWATGGLEFQFLTKRAERLLSWAQGDHGNLFKLPLHGLWFGVTAENQQRLYERLPLLLQVPAFVRWLSVEPLLGPLDLSAWLGNDKGLAWVVAGCESGPKRRQADPEWFRNLRDQCQAAGVAFFLKQLEVAGKVQVEPELDGQRWLQFPSEGE